MIGINSPTNTTKPSSTATVCMAILILSAVVIASPLLYAGVGHAQSVPLAGTTFPLADILYTQKLSFPLCH